jgi:hypothetical protein
VKKLYVFYIALFVMQGIVAFISAPYSCEWGNEVYFDVGIFCLVISFLLPFFQKHWTTGKRIGLGFLFLLISVILWCAGFMIFNFKVLCRLF